VPPGALAAWLALKLSGSPRGRHISQSPPPCEGRGWGEGEKEAIGNPACHFPIILVIAPPTPAPV